ncbi:MAG: hypothetical protein Q8R16_03120 [bacterium]|nr:hypothetical protein [bacterium]
MAPQPTPSASEQSTQNFAALSDALIARLAAEIPLDKSPPLSAEQERQIDRIAWQSVAESCISSMVHVLFDAARQDLSGLQTRFVDEDLERIAAAHIAAPFNAGRFGLSAAEQHQAAALTVEIFRDRTRFAVPTFFVMDGLLYIVQRSDDELFVLARR